MACKRQLATSTAEGHEGAPSVEEPVQKLAESSLARLLKSPRLDSSAGCSRLRPVIIRIAGYMAPSDERAGAYSLSVDTNLLAGPSAVVLVPQKSARQGTRAKSLFCHTTFQATGKRPVACASSIAYLFKSFNDRI